MSTWPPSFFREMNVVGVIIPSVPHSRGPRSSRPARNDAVTKLPLTATSTACGGVRPRTPSSQSSTSVMLRKDTDQHQCPAGQTACLPVVARGDNVNKLASSPCTTYSSAAQMSDGGAAPPMRPATARETTPWTQRRGGGAVSNAIARPRLSEPRRPRRGPNHSNSKFRPPPPL